MDFQVRPAAERNPLAYETDGGGDQRLERCRGLLGETGGLSPMLRAAILLDAGNAIELLQHRTEPGRRPPV
jgi:hypothetical protein